MINLIQNFFKLKRGWIFLFLFSLNLPQHMCCVFQPDDDRCFAHPSPVEIIFLAFLEWHQFTGRPPFYVHFPLLALSLFFPICDRKKNTQKDDFNQRKVCEAPISWSKYTRNIVNPTTMEKDATPKMLLLVNVLCI